jgi:hypothetical protein
MLIASQGEIWAASLMRSTYDLGVVRVLLDLLAQLPDVDAQVLRVLGVRRSPNGGQQLPVRHHLAGILTELGIGYRIAEE